MALAQHRIKVSYQGGLADHHALPGYDGATSIDGIVRAFHIATHAYMTGEVVTRATALKRADIHIKPPRQGSFVFELLFLMEQNPATTGAAAALLAAPFYDFIKTAFRRATGAIDAEPETSHLKGLYSRKEPPLLKRPPADLDTLSEALEGSLQAAHRPIGEGELIRTITIGSPRTHLVTFDADSRDWVNTRDEAVLPEVLTGNVTRYNAVSRNGRIFVDQLERIVPARPDGDFSTGDLQHLTWSLHGSNIGGNSKLDLRARRVTSASGKVKRLLLSGCGRTPID